MIRLAMIGLDQSACEQIAKRLQGVSLAAAAEDCDAVAVLGAPPAPVPCIKQWLSTRKHVVFSSDFDLSSETLSELSALGKQNGVHVRMMNPAFFDPARQEVWGQIQAGKLGDVGLVRCHRWEAFQWPKSVAALDLARLLAPDLCLASWLVGARQVEASLPNQVFAISRLGAVVAHLRFPNGAMAVINLASRLPGEGNYYSLSVIGSSGAAYADDQHNVQLLYAGGNRQALRNGFGILPMVSMLKTFVNQIESGIYVSMQANSSRNTPTMSDAVRGSLETGCAVSLEHS